LTEQIAHVNGIDICYETFGDATDRPLLLVQGAVGQMIWWATARAMPRALYEAGAQPDPEVIAHWTRSLRSAADVATLGRYAFQYAYETKGGHQGVHVSCPTLIVHGGRDRIIPVYSSRELHQQIPGSDFVVLPKSGHCPQLDNPAEVVRLTVALLKRVGDTAERTTQ
jgi:pimeloyl-ACP methyl ester carboxylesterase